MKNDRNCPLVIIPTKESVFWPLLEGRSDLARRADLRALVDNERRVHERVTAEFQGWGLPYVELLGPLREAARREAIYPYADGHPNAKGCAVIATAVQAELEAMRIAGAEGGRTAP